MTKPEPEQYSEEEAARRRDEVVRRMLNTPPKPREKPKGAAAPRKSAS